MRRLALIILFLIPGCSHERVQKVAKNQMPPLPGHYVRGATKLPSLAEFPQALLLTWQCESTPDAADYLTGIEATSDFRTWREVARLPYSASNSLTLTNSQPFEFYRAFTTIKQYEKAP